MKILITGDFVLQQNYPLEYIDNNIRSLFQHSDFNIINLEAPVTNSSTKITKTGPHLKSHHDSTLTVLKALKTNLVTLANNHILDYSADGVKDTIEFCKTNDIATVGAGSNLNEASSIFYLQSEEGKIAIINIAENEWASADENSAGSNGMDIINNTLQIKEAKENADFVFVIVHGGHEYYNLPSPRIQKQYRYYIDLGVDLVVGHHTHCISGSETYKNKSIYYSLGNFLFQNNSVYKDWFKGAVLEVDIKNRNLLTNIRFINIEKETFAIKLSEGSDIKSDFNNYSHIIQNKSLLEKSWKDYVTSKQKTFVNYWTPFSSIGNRYLKKIFLKLGIDGISRKSAILHSNLLRCEAHFDLTKEFFKNKMK